MVRRPVVFVPGFPASSLEEAATGWKIFPPSLSDLLDKKRKKRLIELLQGPDDPDAEDGVIPRTPIRYSIDVPILDLGKEAQSLYDILETIGYDTKDGADFIGVGWDWRRPVDATQTLDRVEKAIDDLHRAHGHRVMILAHSTGGLVVRALLEARPGVIAKIERLVAIAVPWLGTLKSFRLAAIGEKVGVGPIALSANEVRSIMSHAWAAFDLMPPDPSKTGMRDTEGDIDLFTANGKVSSPLVSTSWFDAAAEPWVKKRVASSRRRLGARDRYFDVDSSHAVPVTNLVGWGFGMDTRCELVSRSSDGKKAPWFEQTPEGDGTVPRRSAAWLRDEKLVATLYVPVGVYADQVITQKHSQLWRTPPVRAILGTILAGDKAQPHVWAAVDHDTATDRRRRVIVRIAASDGRGRPLSRCRAVIRVGSVPPEIDLSANVRGEVSFSRANLLPNIGTRFFRFEAEVRWQEGTSPRRIERPLIIEV